MNYDRRIKCKGRLIQIYGPTEPERTPPFWEDDDEGNYGVHFVPKKYKIRVVKAHIAFV